LYYKFADNDYREVKVKDLKTDEYYNLRVGNNYINGSDICKLVDIILASNTLDVLDNAINNISISGTNITNIENIPLGSLYISTNEINPNETNCYRVGDTNKDEEVGNGDINDLINKYINAIKNEN